MRCKKDEKKSTLYCLTAAFIVLTLILGMNWTTLAELAQTFQSEEIAEQDVVKEVLEDAAEGSEHIEDEQSQEIEADLEAETEQETKTENQIEQAEQKDGAERVTGAAVGEVYNMPQPTSETPLTTIDISTTDNGSDGYTIASNVLTFLEEASGRSYNIVHTTQSTRKFTRIVVGAGVNLQLNITDINLSASNTASPIELKQGASLTLQLNGTNTVKATATGASGTPSAGILVPKGAELKISGDGILNVTGGTHGAGIGGYYDVDTGTITIESGTITAAGGEYGAGIGGGGNGENRETTRFPGRDGGTIRINGGNLKVAGGTDAAGIGGGSGNNNGGNSGDIEITNGTLNVTSGTCTNDTNPGPSGIGGGYGWRGATAVEGGAGEKIMISGGDITVQSSGTGIGGGYQAGSGDIVISGGSVTVSRVAVYCTGLGSGYKYDGAGGTITIKGGRTEIKAGQYGAGIGTGRRGRISNIDIYDGTIIAIGGERGAAIGGGLESAIGDINIYDGNVTATNNGEFGVGIGAGREASMGSVYIHGGTIQASGASSGAGIGTGHKGNMNNIVIYKGHVIAAGGSAASYISGAGIGTGRESSMGEITIYDGRVEAVGGAGGAGIGTGYNSSMDSIFIYGGEIEAFSSESASGIGTGRAGKLSRIVIEDGEITAAAKTSDSSTGSGIGLGGLESSGALGSIQIKGGNIHATGCGRGAGIGTYNEKVTTISISGGTVYAVGGSEKTSGGPGIGSADHIGNQVGLLEITGGSVTAISGPSNSAASSLYAMGGAAAIKIDKEAEVFAASGNKNGDRGKEAIVGPLDRAYNTGTAYILNAYVTLKKNGTKISSLSDTEDRIIQIHGYDEEGDKIDEKTLLLPAGYTSYAYTTGGIAYTEYHDVYAPESEGDMEGTLIGYLVRTEDEERELTSKNPDLTGVPVRYQKGSVAGTVWVDENKDGKIDSDEAGLEDVEVEIYERRANGRKRYVTTVTTDENGKYHAVVYDGDFYVKFPQLRAYGITVLEHDNNAGQDGLTDIFNIKEGETQDASVAMNGGYILPDTTANLNLQKTVNGETEITINSIGETLDYVISFDFTPVQDMKGYKRLEIQDVLPQGLGYLEAVVKVDGVPVGSRDGELDYSSKNRTLSYIFAESYDYSSLYKKEVVMEVSCRVRSVEGDIPEQLTNTARLVINEDAENEMGLMTLEPQATVYIEALIKGTAFIDMNNNGMLEPKQDELLEGVEVILLEIEDDEVKGEAGRTETDENGTYSFHLKRGQEGKSYKVKFPEEINSITPTVIGDEDNSNHIDAEGYTDVVLISTEGTTLHHVRNAGYGKYDDSSGSGGSGGGDEGGNGSGGNDGGDEGGNGGGDGGDEGGNGSGGNGGGTEPEIAIITGCVFEDDGDERLTTADEGIEDAVIWLYEINEGTEDFLQRMRTDNDGNYTFEVEAGKSYIVKFQRTIDAMGLIKQGNAVEEDVSHADRITGKSHIVIAVNGETHVRNAGYQEADTAGLEFSKSVRIGDGTYGNSITITDKNEVLEYQLQAIFPEKMAGYHNVTIRDCLPEELVLATGDEKLDVDISIDGVPVEDDDGILTYDKGKWMISYTFADDYNVQTLSEKTVHMTIRTRIADELIKIPERIINSGELLLNMSRDGEEDEESGKNVGPGEGGGKNPGINLQKGVIEGYLFIDKDNNCLRDVQIDEPLAGHMVHLFREEGDEWDYLASAESDEYGYYRFTYCAETGVITELFPFGNYRIIIELDREVYGYVKMQADGNILNGIGSDVNKQEEILFTLSASQKSPKPSAGVWEVKGGNGSNGGDSGGNGNGGDEEGGGNNGGGGDEEGSGGNGSGGDEGGNGSGGNEGGTEPEMSIITGHVFEDDGDHILTDADIGIEDAVVLLYEIKNGAKEYVSETCSEKDGSYTFEAESGKTYILIFQKTVDAMGLVRQGEEQNPAASHANRMIGETSPFTTTKKETTIRNAGYLEADTTGLEFTKSVRCGEGDYGKDIVITGREAILEYQLKVTFPDKMDGYHNVTVRDSLPSELVLATRDIKQDVEIRLEGELIEERDGSLTYEEKNRNITYTFAEEYDVQTLASKTLVMVIRTKLVDNLPEIPERIINNGKLILNMERNKSSGEDEEDSGKNIKPDEEDEKGGSGGEDEDGKGNGGGDEDGEGGSGGGKDEGGKGNGGGDEEGKGNGGGDEEGKDGSGGGDENGKGNSGGDEEDGKGSGGGKDEGGKGNGGDEKGKGSNEGGKGDGNNNGGGNNNGSGNNTSGGGNTSGSNGDKNNNNNNGGNGNNSGNEDGNQAEEDNTFKKMPLDKQVYPGRKTDFAIRGFGNDTDTSLKSYSITDILPEGLTFETIRIPAFTNGAGLHYKITYITNKSGYRTLEEKVPADKAFVLRMPELEKDEWISHITIEFKEVTPGFGIGDQIVVTCRVDANPPQKHLVNQAVLGYEGMELYASTSGIEIGAAPKTGDSSNMRWLFGLVMSGVVWICMSRKKNQFC